MMSSPTSSRHSVAVAIITLNEAQNIRRTLESVRWASEIVVLDSGSTDGTPEIARSLGAKVFHQPWLGFARQKNAALERCTADWLLSLDADEEVMPELAQSILQAVATAPSDVAGFWVARRNYFLGRWIRRGGFYPDRKLRLFRRGAGQFQDRPVHETATVEGQTRALTGDLLHHAYPTLSGYLDHLNRYSSLGAEAVVGRGRIGFNLANIIFRPAFTFVYNYFIRLGFLDGREGLLLHLYHAAYVSWKYAKAWELGRPGRPLPPS